MDVGSPVGGSISYKFKEKIQYIYIYTHMDVYKIIS